VPDAPPGPLPPPGAVVFGAAEQASVKLGSAPSKSAVAARTLADLFDRVRSAPIERPFTKPPIFAQDPPPGPQNYCKPTSAIETGLYLAGIGLWSRGEEDSSA
jgi:hypothetical protein